MWYRAGLVAKLRSPRNLAKSDWRNMTDGQVLQCYVGELQEAAKEARDAKALLGFRAFGEHGDYKWPELCAPTKRLLPESTWLAILSEDYDTSAFALFGRDPLRRPDLRLGRDRL